MLQLLLLALFDDNTVDKLMWVICLFWCLSYGHSQSVCMLIVRYVWCAPLSHPSFCIYFTCLWIMDPHSRTPKKNMSHGNEVLLQDTLHLTQRPCYQRGSLCQDQAGSRITQRPSDHCKEMQTAVVRTCLPFIKAQWKEGEDKADRGRGGKTTSGYGRAWSSPSPRRQWRKGKYYGGKPSVVPQWPSRLRDRWGEKWLFFVI